MIQPIVIMEVYNKHGNSDSGYYYELDGNPNKTLSDFKNLTIKTSSVGIKDSISFTLPNNRELNYYGNYTFDYDSYNLNIKDLIKVYAYNAPLSNGLVFSDLTEVQKQSYHLITGYVKSFSYNSTSSIGNISIQAFNRTEVLLNSFMFAPYNEPIEVSNMIVDTGKKLQTYNKNDKVYAYKDYSGLSVPGQRGAYNILGVKQTVTYRDGTERLGYVKAYKEAAYDPNNKDVINPAILDSNGKIIDKLDENGNSLYYQNKMQHTESYKPFMEQLGILSKPKYTGDDDAGIYIFTVSEKNDLHWGFKTYDSKGTVNESDVVSVNIKKDADEVVNAIILNCGTDPNHSGIISLSINTTSMGKYGARWAYRARNDIADNIRKKEMKSGSWKTSGDEEIIGTPNGTNNYSLGDDGYPVDNNTGDFPSSPEWIIQTSGSGKDLDGSSWEYVAGVSTVSSRKKYKDYLRRVALIQGRNIGDGIVKYSDEAIWSGSWDLEYGNNIYTPGDLVQIQVPSISLADTDNDNLYIRIETITHNFTGDSWATILELKEDVDLKWRNANV